MNRSVVWGVDPGVNRLAIAIRGAFDTDVMLVSIELDAPETVWQKRLASIYQYVEKAAERLALQGGYPVAIALERPSGRSKTNVHLVQAYGVLQAAIAHGIDVFAGETAWLEVGAGEWKKEVLDDGSLDTFQYCARLRELGVEFQNADEAAAYWIAAWADAKIVR